MYASFYKMPIAWSAPSETFRGNSSKVDQIHLQGNRDDLVATGEGSKV